jgi:ABC-2 type transport system ATP-binding protein
MMNKFLSIKGVTKAYKSTIAVNHASFDVPEGSLFGLLGPNGAGKTSLIRMITGITLPDSGQIYLGDKTIDRRMPGLIGYLPEERGLYKKMKVGEHLMYLAQLRGLSEAEARQNIGNWLERLEAKDWWNRKIEELSKGMQQKIQFIATVVHNPRLLILDEPFSGLDPVNTNLIKSEIRRLNSEGTTVIFSTHRMEQVEEICERIALINKGTTILEGSVAEIKENHKQNIFNISTKEEINLDTGYPGDILEQNRNHIKVRVEGEDDANVLLRSLIEQGLHIKAFNEVLPSLNDIFIQLVSEVKTTA